MLVCACQGAAEILELMHVPAMACVSALETRDAQEMVHRGTQKPPDGCFEEGNREEVRALHQECN
jgi:hypothetical protein